MSPNELPARDYHARVCNPGDGVVIAITVMQPVLAAGQDAPLILQGHGFGGARLQSRDELSVYEQLSGGILPSTEAARRAADAGYFVISFDQRGFGESGGRVEVMDPTIEGEDIRAILDWAEHDMDHGERLARRDGQLVVGGLGLSYGGGFQLIGACVDPRFTAIVPTAAWHDLTYSLAPDNVVKTAWGAALVALGVPTSGVRVDPRLYRALIEALVSPLTGRGLSAPISDWLYNSSPASFYDGTIARDGERVACPDRSTPRVDALLVQGVGDTLFNLNEAAANARALADAGNDVHMIAMQYGHSLPFLQDIERIAYQTDATLAWHGKTVETAALELAYLDWKLKGIAPEHAFPRCMVVLDDATALTFDTLPDLASGYTTAFDFEGAAATGGIDLLLGLLRRQSLAHLWSLGRGAAANTTRAVVQLIRGRGQADGHDTGLLARLVNALPSDHLDELASGGSFIPLTDIDRDCALAGLPHAVIEIGGNVRAPIAFLGIGVQRPGVSATLLLNKQVRPIRGCGLHEVELNGVAFRLQPGDTVRLLVYGFHPQYLSSFSPIGGYVDVSGCIDLPIVDVG